MAKKNQEEFKVSGADVVEKVKEIIEAGNARKVTILNEKNEKIIEFPLTVGAVGVLIAPILAAVGVVTALVTKCTVIVEKLK